ncbi:WEB family protein At3g02930, chloroplastic-like isoform X2 [Zingiber officinale]|uniref:WEB family protein At3g02930, chloroplastic-like isoform X2 n=1 Tax=Zingiber officinale TaxID=94328 RepID=UPI001C4AB6E2|nr:WEB family protein At3g02930, chloroplastic-like isoform X2 [Zingiber officinale]
MFSSKSKSGLSDASINKGAPSTPKGNKSGKAGSTKVDPASPSPQQSARLSIDRSLKLVDSKITIEQRSPKITALDKQPRPIKGSELQGQLSAIQDELKKAKERLASVEKEKIQILEELKYAKRCANEANDKLQDALVAQRIAEEASEIDKFRADELEQAGIDAALKKEDELQKELDIVQNQHAMDVAALLAITKDLQRVKNELFMTTEAKNSALNHADDAMKIAEINAEKVDLLSKEVNRLKVLVDSVQEFKNTDSPAHEGLVSREVNHSKASIDALQECEKKEPSVLVVNGTNLHEQSNLVEDHLKKENDRLISVEAEKNKQIADLQAQINLVQEDLTRANELLTSVETEKTHILKELTEAKRLVYETSNKLNENFAAQRQAEEAMETYKILSCEFEQKSIESAQKREELKKQLEYVEDQNALNAATLLSITKELEQVKNEFTLAIDAKDTALTQACDAMMSAEINSEKLELLSGEIEHLKALLDSKVELESELFAVKSELEKAKVTEARLIEMEALVEALTVEVSDVNNAESEARHLVEQWKKAAELLEAQLEETNESRKSSLEALASVKKQLEECYALLQDKECELSVLTGKVDSLNLEVSRHETELDGSIQKLAVALQEAAELEKTIALLKSDLQIVEATKNQALNSEKVANSNIESLTEQKKNLENELDITRCELDKAKQAMEGLASALHEVSTEAHVTQERFVCKQAEVEDSHAQIKDLKMTIMKNQENYDEMLEKSKHEHVCLQDALERFEMVFENSVSEWNLKALDFLNSIQRSEEEIATMKTDMDKISDSLKAAELRIMAAQEDEVQLIDKLKHFESEANIIKLVAEEAKAENLQLKEMLLEKDNDLQSKIQENNELKIRETAALDKAQDFSSLLAEATAEKAMVNGEISINVNQSDLAVPFVSLEETTYDEHPNSEVPSEKLEEHSNDLETSQEEKSINNAPQEPQGDTESKLSENGKAVDKDLPTEKEYEVDSMNDESYLKADCANSNVSNGLPSDNIQNDGTSPNKQEQQQKKKKAFMQKFGSILKKKSNLK